MSFVSSQATYLSVIKLLLPLNIFSPISSIVGRIYQSQNDCSKSDLSNNTVKEFRRQLSKAAVEDQDHILLLCQAGEWMREEKEPAHSPEWTFTLIGLHRSCYISLDKSYLDGLIGFICLLNKSEVLLMKRRRQVFKVNKNSLQREYKVKMFHLQLMSLGHLFIIYTETQPRTPHSLHPMFFPICPREDQGISNLLVQNPRANT